MDIKTIASEILTATTHHIQSAAKMSESSDEGKTNEAINSMQIAEVKLMVALENFRKLILNDLAKISK